LTPWIRNSSSALKFGFSFISDPCRRRDFFNR
jgi:hypothetical protein